MKRKIYIILFSIICFGLVGCEGYYNNVDEDIPNNEYKFVNENFNIIGGVWSASLKIDSVVLIFENKLMKEYIYDKQTKILLDRIDHGEYSLTYYPHGSKNRYIILEFRTEEKRSSYMYELNKNILRIYNADSNSFVDYLRMDK